MPVRLATAADVAALARVINRAYVAEAHIFDDARTNEAEVRDRLARPNACFLVIDDPARSWVPGALAGAVYVELRGERSYFGMLSVDPDRQGLGLGRALITAAEARCREAGARFMDIDVVEQRPELPGFYATFGYSATGTTPFVKTRTKMPVRMVHMTKAL
jgi:GNAT superfamily N-acetyltransferase